MARLWQVTLCSSEMGSCEQLYTPFTVASAVCMLQYYTSTGLPSRKLEPGVCAVCGNKIIVLDNADAIVEKTYKLTCDHMYPSC